MISNHEDLMQITEINLKNIKFHILILPGLCISLSKLFEANVSLINNLNILINKE